MPPALEGGFFTTGPPGKSQGDVVLHSSFLLETLRSLGLVSGDSGTGSGGPRGYRSVTFFLE